MFLKIIPDGTWEGNKNILEGGSGTVWGRVGPFRSGPARLGSAGLAQFGLARLSSARLGPARLGSAWLGPGFARIGSPFSLIDSTWIRFD